VIGAGGRHDPPGHKMTMDARSAALTGQPKVKRMKPNLVATIARSNATEVERA
jgi:hypothetical protein